jgi:hypothetical protein
MRTLLEVGQMSRAERVCLEGQEGGEKRTLLADLFYKRTASTPN